MGKYVLYSHAGSKNHGCEALLRTSCMVIDDIEAVYSEDVKADQEYNLNEIVVLYPEKTEGFDSLFEKIIYYIRYHLHKDDRIFFKNLYRKFIENIDSSKIYISIGGDNYCYHFSSWLEVLNTAINTKKAKTVLWGCSINEDEFQDREVIADLKKYKLITARESITFSNLKKYLPNSNIQFVPDTAFLLPKIEKRLPDGFQEGNTIGLNVSPVAVKNTTTNNFIEYIIELVDYIILNTDYQIALIPHVVFEGNDDREILKIIQRHCVNPNRTVMIEDDNCMVLKGYISRCELFIGARTHATIAAYSSMVPTLVLGYSVKARGIARDLFGTEDNYVISVQDLKSGQKVIDSFCWIEKRKNNIRNILQDKLEKYCDKIKCANVYLENL